MQLYQQNQKRWQMEAAFRLISLVFSTLDAYISERYVQRSVGIITIRLVRMHESFGTSKNRQLEGQTGSPRVRKNTSKQSSNFIQA